MKSSGPWLGAQCTIPVPWFKSTNPASSIGTSKLKFNFENGWLHIVFSKSVIEHIANTDYFLSEVKNSTKIIYNIYKYTILFLIIDSTVQIFFGTDIFGIKPENEDLMRISGPFGDKYILGRKQIDIALKKLDQERRALLKARDQGGVIAVEADGVLITAYRFDSFNRKLAQL